MCNCFLLFLDFWNEGTSEVGNMKGVSVDRQTFEVKSVFCCVFNILQLTLMSVTVLEK